VNRGICLPCALLLTPRVFKISNMKKFLKITGITLVSILALLIILPFAFKGKIKSAIIEAANENLNARFNFEDVSLSLIKNFPNLHLTIEGISIENTGDFEGVTLAKIEKIETVIDLSSLFGDEYKIRKLGLNRPVFDVRVMADGRANYDIAKASADTTDTAADEPSTPFKMNLKEYFIRNSDIRYEDQTFPMTLTISDMTHEGSGDFTSDLFVLQTLTTMASLDVVYDGTRYIKNARTNLKADLDMDMKAMKFTFKENELKMNELGLKVDGWLAMPDENMDMDIQFSTLKNDFRELLSMVPAEFASDLQGVDVTGTMSFSGFVRGRMNDTSMPGFGLDIAVDKGRFKYPDLPSSVDNIYVKASIDASDGNDYDKMKIDVSRFDLTMAGNPVSATLALRTPMSDPDIDCTVKAFLDFDKIKDIVPLTQGDKLTGTLDADVAMRGRLSAVEQEEYDRFHAAGGIRINGMLYTSDSIAYDMMINKADFAFSPQFLALNAFDATIGRSDLSASGRIDNYLQYFLRDSLLEGTFALRSRLMDLNEFVSAEEETATAEEAPADSATGVIEIPGNVRFVLNSTFDRMVYDNIEMTNINGQITVDDRVARLRNLYMNLMEGKLGMNGTYDSRDIAKPTFDFDFDIRDFDIQKTATTFNTVDKLAPIASKCAGRFSTALKMKSLLDVNMIPIESTITGSGTLQTKSVFIQGFEPLNKLASELGIKRLEKQTIDDIRVSYRFEDGKIITDPFTVKLDGMPATLEGHTTFSQEIDYSMKMDVPMGKLPGNLTTQASGLLGQINSQLGSNISIGSKIPVKLRITGTVTNPKIAANYGEVAKGAVQDLKEEVKELIKEEVKEVIDNTKAEAIAKAKAEADKLMAEAQKTADKIKAEAQSAADKVKAEGYKQAQDLEKSAKNPLEKGAKKLAADQLRKETDKKAQQLKDEADKQANKILAEAQNKADALIKKAEGI